ncbi:Hypothetical protein HVR_LOCUS1324 [uncultured virus]|nr:Hypothetical protein HVR_LOCUS1324 [uncultured virus]
MSVIVTVGPKPVDHPFAGKGSKYCFYLDGTPGKHLELTSGTTYTFSIDTPGHPFYFTRSESGGSDDNNPLSNFPPTDKGTVTFTMPKDYPDKFYYRVTLNKVTCRLFLNSFRLFWIKFQSF